MSILRLTPADYAVSRWSGGTTTQIAIAPAGARYADRSFLWRLSSAAVELETSDFTPLPDYRRWISVLWGSMTLVHGAGEPLTLTPYAVHAFDGGVPTRSRGRCADFNLMLRKGAAEGTLRALSLSAGGESVLAVPAAGPFPRATLAVFCGEGGVILACGAERVALAPMETALLSDAAGRTVTVSAPAGAALLSAEIWSR